MLIVGTSLTAGLGLDPEAAYPALLQRLADSAHVAIEVVNAGVSGETSAGARRRIGWLLRQHVDALVLESGANDGLRGLDIDSTRANLRAIVGEVKRAQPGARVMLVQMEAPPNLGARYTRDFHAMFEEVARSEQIILLPFLLRDVAGRAGLNQADGIHPNEAGSKVVAATLWPSLAASLGK